MRITYIYGGVCRKLIVASAHLPYDSHKLPPTKKVRDIIDYCHNRKRNSSSDVMPMHTTH
jgi:hypothetical protein